MGAEKRKSKKRSDASSQRQREEPVRLFLDRNLGKHIIAEKLRSVGMKVEVHDDHLPPDEDWLALVGKKGWVALTKDKNIRYRIAELDSIQRHSARVIVIRARDAMGSDIAEPLVKGRSRITRFVAKTTAPFVAEIDRRGRVRPYQNIQVSGSSAHRSGPLGRGS